MKAALFSFAATVVMVGSSMLLQGSTNPARTGNESRPIPPQPATVYACPSLPGEDASRCPYLESQTEAFQDDAPPLEDNQEGEDPETGCPYLQDQRTPEVRRESDQNLQLFRMI